MKSRKKNFLLLITLGVLFVFSSILKVSGADLRVLTGQGGGTGIATTTASSVGKFLRVASTTPFLTYDFASAGGGSGGGVATSGSPVATNISFFTDPNTISGSSSLTYTSSTNTFAVVATSTFTGKFTQTDGLVGLASTTITGTAAVTGVANLNGLTNNGNATTTNITITAISGSTQCLHVNSAGVVTGTGSDCGAGASIVFLANGGAFVTTSTINFQAGTNVTIATSTNGTYTISATGGSGSSGTVTTSTAVTVGYFPTWGTASALTGTSTIFQSGLLTGIGTTQPSSTLHVIGDINASQGVYKQNNLTILTGSSTIGTTFAGLQAGNGNTTGQNNTYLGHLSGFVGATSSNNTFVGARSGYNNVSQFFGNTFVGYFAGNTNTSGYGNAFFGYQAGLANDTSIQNTFIGNRAGENATNGNGSNVAVGNLAGYANSGTENTFLGATAGQNNTGDKNVFIGSGVGAANTSGQLNTFVGSGAGFSNTTGQMNIFFGNQAGFTNATGTSIIAIGDHAGYTNMQNDGFYLGNYAGQLSTGIENTFVGQNAGRLNTTGLGNTNFGFNSGYGNATGSYNTFFGNRAGQSGNPNQSVFFGYQAGELNIGTDGVFIGFQSGKLKTSGNDNQFIGSYAGYNNTTGASNVLIGSQALYSNATGSNNTALGYQAGYYNKGQRNVFLGNNAGMNETGNDKLYIANSNTASPLVYGDFSASRIGVNTSQPSSTVHVVGTATITASTTLSYITGSTQCLQANSAGVVSGTGTNCGLTSLASSSASFNIYDATSTSPYKFSKIIIPFNATITNVLCDEFAAATSTIQIFKNSTLATSTASSDIVSSIACGINGTTTTSFTTSTLQAGDFLFANVTSTAGTPLWTSLHILFKKT